VQPAAGGLSEKHPSEKHQFLRSFAEDEGQK
jgi:hypothetical protein